MRRVVLLASVLSLAGCGVLTINVDVYKGPLANHERVQTEQVAAMAMGAKPLLLELRLKMECAEQARRAAEDARSSDVVDATRTTCERSDLTRRGAAVPDRVLESRDARRVNAILGLYERAQKGEVNSLLVPLVEEMKTLRRRVDDLNNHVKTLKLGVMVDLQVILRAEQAAERAWTAAMRLLTETDTRRRLLEIKQDDVDMLENVSWIAAQLTSADGLRQPVREPTLKTLDKLLRLPKEVPALGREEKFRSRSEFKPILAYVFERLRCSNDDRPKENRCPHDGRLLAEDLLRAHGYALSRQRDLQTNLKSLDTVLHFCAVVDCPRKSPSLADREIKDLQENTEDVQSLLDSLNQRVIGAGLERGRPDKGLEDLIDTYLRIRDERPGDFWDSESNNARDRLLDALINFAEKVLVIANNDPLVRERPQGAAAYQNPLDPIDRYIQVLQAVGNSILSQVDELRHRWTQINRALEVRPIEAQGLSNAEAAVVGAVLAEARQDLARVLSTQEMTSLKTALDSADTKLDDLIQALRTERANFDTERENQAVLARPREVTFTILTGDDLAKKATARLDQKLPVPLATVVGEVNKDLRKEEDKERASTPGVKNQRADDLVTARDTLSSLVSSGAIKVSDATPDVVIGHALEQLRVLKTTASEEESKAKTKADGIAAALAKVDQFKARRQRVALPADPNATRSAKDVMDVMLATLRYEHLLAVKTDGPDSPKSKNLAAAVELNHAYRSGLVYIRPASAYLRNSYPATVLQDDPITGAWRNMLTQQALRQIPFYSDLIRDERVRTTAFIDKQFWQSVNQVRLAGAGDTNYAIAKDDIGNWYVKSYASDPRRIFESARNLALFAAGPAGGGLVASRTRGIRDVGIAGGGAPGVPAPGGVAPGVAAPAPAAPELGEGQPTAPAAAAPPPSNLRSETTRSTLDVQFERFTARYEAAIRASHKSLKARARALPDQLRTTAVASIDDATERQKVDEQVFAAAAIPPRIAALRGQTPPQVAEADEADKTKTVRQLNDEAAEIVRAMAQYRAELLRRIREKKRADDSSPATGDARTIKKSAGDRAEQVVRDGVREAIDRALRDRETAANDYDSVLLIVGESAGVQVPTPR